MISPALARTYGVFRLNFERLGVLSGTLLIMVIFYFLSPYFYTVLLRLVSLLTGLSI